MTQQVLFDDEKKAGISFEDVANQLEVSVATVRNWIKTGYLNQIKRGVVSKKSFDNFKTKVAGGEKLTARANKSLKDSHNHDEVLSKFFSQLDKGEISGAELGAKYEQELSNSYRNKEGVYYTPTNITEPFFQYLPKECSRLSFCDPCCGSGNFIITAIDHGIRPENIHGYDVDPFAVEVTKKRILERTGYVTSKIKCIDFLESTLTPNQPCFDIIFTNPPWGKKIQKNQREIYARTLGAGNGIDTSSLFFLASLKRLSDGGYLGFLLQDAFFNIASYEVARIRALSLQIKSVIDFGKPFAGLLTKAKGIIIKNSKSAKKNMVDCSDKNEKHRRLQGSFLENPKSILNSNASQDESDAISHLYSLPHLTLFGRAQWGLGIVTGNNKKFIIDEPAEGYIAAYKGLDLKRDGIADPSAFIPSDLSLYQQVAPKKLYEAKVKLVYRFIFSELVFYCDTKQRYILNSANLLIPNADLPISPAQLSEILNSKVVNWVFQSLFDTHKVLRSDIEALPIHVDYFNQFNKFDNRKYAIYLNLEEFKDGAFRIKK